MLRQKLKPPNKNMKNIVNARKLIIILGLLLIAAAFFTALLPSNSLYITEFSASKALPQDVHIPININTSPKETLCLLDGIGDTLADNIIYYRTEYGNFNTKEEIKGVYGIGEITYEKIKNYICV